MSKTEILVVGNNQAIMQSVVNEINNIIGWNAVAAPAGEDAIEKFHQRNVDLVILLSDITGTEELKLNKIFTHQSPDLIMVKQKTSDIGLLENDIKTALGKWKKENKPSFNFADDALKNAGLNIMIQ